MHLLARRGSLAGAAVVALVVAACNAQGGSTPVPTLAPQSSSAAAASGATLTVEVHQDATLGAFLTDQDGNSLYMLTKDSPGTSTCTAACATTWPPFVLTSGQTAVAGTGVMGTLGAITRPDGGQQVAINGIPLYHFSGDSAAGQTNGQGFKGIWFLVSPSGTAVASSTTSPGSGASPTSGTKPGY